MVKANPHPAILARLVKLGDPHRFAFDETYYAKDAWSLLNHGYVRDYVEEADKQILAGELSRDALFRDGPSMIVHPEVGKWLIALGEKAFGMDSFGWRFSAAVIGTKPQFWLQAALYTSCTFATSDFSSFSRTERMVTPARFASRSIAFCSRSGMRGGIQYATRSLVFSIPAASISPP